MTSDPSWPRAPTDSWCSTTSTAVLPASSTALESVEQTDLNDLAQMLFIASACVAADGSDRLMATERMMQPSLWASDDDLGFELWIDAHRMRWHAGGVTMFFFKVDREPLPGGRWVSPAGD